MLFNGKVEYKTIKHREQIIIKKAGKIVDFFYNKNSQMLILKAVCLIFVLMRMNFLRNY